MIKGVTHGHLEPIWNSEPSDIPIPKPVSWLGLFCRLLQQAGSSTIFAACLNKPYQFRAQITKQTVIPVELNI